MNATYWPRRKRRVIADFPTAPSPIITIDSLRGGGLPWGASFVREVNLDRDDDDAVCGCAESVRWRGERMRCFEEILQQVANDGLSLVTWEEQLVLGTELLDKLLPEQ